MTSPKNKNDLMRLCYELAGKNLAELAFDNNITLPKKLTHSKGIIGQILEMSLGATGFCQPIPDFPNLGIELKTIPVNNKGEPKESTYVCTAPIEYKMDMNWDNSWVKKKLSKVLWIPIEAEKNIAIEKRRIGMPILWSPSKEEEKILKNDWEELMDKLILGEINKLSAHHGVYMQIRPKAANSKQLINYYNTNCELNKTVPKGFYLRTLFTKQILLSNYLGG